MQLDLAKDLARHLRGGHPWVFRKALTSPPRAPAGTVVDVTSGGRFVARGLYDPLSPIAVRLLTRDPAEEVGPALWQRRLARAAALRRETLGILAPGADDAFRLVHGENDFLPGVVIDVYAGFAVVKLYSAAWTPHRAALVEALRQAVPGLRGVFGRDEVAREDDERGGGGRPLWGAAPPARLLVREAGARLWVDVRRGQKTGLFLDQRENRVALRRYAPGREVLDCFCFTGAFAVHLALGGARKVTCVDVDGGAIELARESFRENGLDPGAHEFRQADVFDQLALYRREGRSFDLIVLDPPAFAKSQAKVEAAVAGYAALNRAALQLLRPGGYLATASCSARVPPERFAGAIAEAAGKLGLPLQLVEERRQPPDHPVLVSFPQGAYLKLLIYRLPG